MIFAEEYIPKQVKDCSISGSREKFKNKKNKNIRFLLEKRFFWMKSFIKNKKNIIELGSGNGASKEILQNKKIILTDIQKYPWINKKVDMTKLDLGKKNEGKVDVFIINHSLHHCSNPSKLLKKMAIYLKKDIFKSNNPWSANNAVANLLFKNEKKFNFHFSEYKIIKNDLSEFLVFINSGGVVNNTFHIPVNKLVFDFLGLIDRWLIKIFPKIFALNRSVVLKKIN